MPHHRTTKTAIASLLLLALTACAGDDVGDSATATTTTTTTNASTTSTGGFTTTEGTTDTTGVSESDSTTMQLTEGTTGACGPAELICDGACTNTQSDPAHCGGCGAPCDPGELCVAGECAADCPPGQDVCDGICIDPQIDPNNCGECGNTCGECAACADGACAPNPAPAAPGAIKGLLQHCAGADAEFSIDPIPGAIAYNWTAPEGSTVAMGQGSAAVTIDFGPNPGQLCVSVNDGCADSAPTCVDIQISGGAPGAQTFTYTGQPQNFTVPACVSAVTVEAWGAEGAQAKCCDNSFLLGGKGGYVKATVLVTPGEQLGLYVGGKGVSQGAGGFNGGGPRSTWAGGGGGATDVRKGGNALNNRIIVAGGGGAGNCGCPNHGIGGDGGGLNGAPGLALQPGWTAGGGGTQNAGGGPGSSPGQAGALGVGGGPADYHIAGGGGGYYGGGGAYAAGGGGGSSFYGSALNPTTTPGLRLGNGEIKLSW